MPAPVITALVCSARRRGNAYNLADYCLTRLREGPYRRTRLLNFNEYDVQSCHHCEYQCLAGGECPRHDDVAWLWEYCWRSDAVIWAVPTYGGLPPALWLAFRERLQSLTRLAPTRKIPLAIIAIANPDGDKTGEETADVLRRHARDPWWDLIDCVIFSSVEHDRVAAAGDLATVPAVQARLDELTRQIIARLPSERAEEEQQS